MKVEKHICPVCFGEGKDGARVSENSVWFTRWMCNDCIAKLIKEGKIQNVWYGGKPYIAVCGNHAESFDTLEDLRKFVQEGNHMLTAVWHVVEV